MFHYPHLVLIDKVRTHGAAYPRNSVEIFASPVLIPWAPHLARSGPFPYGFHFLRLATYGMKFTYDVYVGSRVHLLKFVKQRSISAAFPPSGGAN
jgi:hypothetical protein